MELEVTQKPQTSITMFQRYLKRKRTSILLVFSRFIHGIEMKIVAATIQASWLAFVLVNLVSAQVDLPTVAEKSEFKATSSSAEVVKFIDTCADRSEWVKRIDVGTTVDGKPMVGALVSRVTDQIDSRDELPRIILLGNIHSGECAGKEALLQLLRELAFDDSHPWLDSATILILPNYNADGNDRVGANNSHRPGQVGPDNGMGVRENAQHLDLNRDFVKLESPEARALITLINDFDPHMLIDCHTTNGSKHRYELTYDVPHNMSSPVEVRKFLRNKMMPAVTAEMAKQDLDAFYYGNLSRDKKSWFTYGHEPRYSTEYVGMRGRLGILSEAYSYISYEDRIKTTHAFVTECVDFFRDNSDDIRYLLEQIRVQHNDVAANNPEGIQMHLGSRPVPFEEPVTILGYDGDEPADLEVDFVANFESTRSVTMPYAYLVGEEFARQVDRLRMHGLQIHQLTEDVEVPVVGNRIKKITKQDRVFQGHQMVSLETSTEELNKTFVAGTYVIPMNQPLGRLGSYLLEPTSDDGLVTWNFFDSWLHEKTLFPVYRVEDDVELPTVATSEIKSKTKLTLDLLFGEKKINFAGSTRPVPTWSHQKNTYQMVWNSTWSSRNVEIDAVTGAMTPIATVWDRDQLLEAFDKFFASKTPKSTEIDRRDILSAANSGSTNPDNSALFLELPNQTFAYLIEQNRVVELSEGESAVELAELGPDGKSIAFITDGNLIVFDIETGKRTQVTDEDQTKLLSGKLDWSYQEELYGRGNFKGFWWSPDSAKIAFLQLDVSEIEPYIIKDNVPVLNNVEVSPYPKAGEAQPIPRLMIYDVASKTTQVADFGQHNDAGCDIVVSRVTWHESSESIAVQVQDREQTFLDLLFVNSGSGKSRLCMRDKTPAWIESPGDPIWVGSDQFLWKSPQDGKNQIYLKTIGDGSNAKRLTSMEFGIQSLIGYRASDQRFFFTAKPDGIRQHVYSQKVGVADVQQLTSASGNHTASFSDDFSYFFDVYSRFATPPSVALKNDKGELVRMIDANIDDQLKYLDINPPVFKTISLKDEKGVSYDANAIMITPTDFDENRKYPVLYHVYAGPQAPTVRDLFRNRWLMWHQMVAQHGYVVFLCDNRSATHLGPDTAWPIHRNLGAMELQDIETTVGWLNQQSWVDSERIGIWGWSYGGYMTAYAMTHSKLFKAGISGAPVTDWRNYDSIYTERYMGTPQNNPEGYDNSSVVKAAGDLHGQMLLIHGEIDDNVHISNTMQLAYELQKAGKKFDLMVYPKNRHSIRDEQQMKHMQQMMLDFILENL